jgi:hypothetical protein
MRGKKIVCTSMIQALALGDCTTVGIKETLDHADGPQLDTPC